MRAFLIALALALATAAAAQPGGSELDRAYDGLVAAHQTLEQAGRADLIGDGPDCLIPSRPPREAIEARRQEALDVTERATRPGYRRAAREGGKRGSPR